MKFGNPLGFSVDISNATIAVTGTVTAEITGPVDVTGSTVNLTAGTAVDVTNDVTVTPSGTINVQGVPGGTTIGIAGAVTVSSGTVAVSSIGGTVAISGTVTATISGTPNVTISGTPTVNLSAGTSVQVSNNVTVTPSGTINVQGVAGGTTVGVAGTVAVSSVSGSVNIGSVSGTVTVAGTVTATISGTPSVTITGTPSVTITSGSVNVGTVGTLNTITNNVNVNQAVISLLNGVHTFTLGSTWSPALNTVTSPFESMRLTLQNSSLVQNQTLTVLVQNTTTGQSWQGTVQGVSQAATPPFSIVAVPVAANVNDTVTIKFSNVNNPGAISAELVGLADGDTVMTAPGSPIASYLVGGTLKVHASLAGSGTVAILPSPPSGMIYSLRRVVYVINAAGTTLELVGHSSSARISVLAAPTSAGIAFTGENLDGDLWNEAIDFVEVGGTGGTADLSYDLVAIPDIS